MRVVDTLGSRKCVQEETQTVSISVRQECTVGGAVVWFDADYGSGIRIHKRL